MFYRNKERVITNGCKWFHYLLCYSGGSVLEGTDDEKAELQAQKESLERQCAELDSIIQNFSHYIESTVRDSHDLSS